MIDVAVNDPFGYGKGVLDMYLQKAEFRTSEQTGVDNTHRHYKSSVYYDISFSHFDASQWESRGSGSFYEYAGEGTESVERGFWDRWFLGPNHRPGGVRDVSLQLAGGELVVGALFKVAKAANKSIIRNGKVVVQGGTPKGSPNVTGPTLEGVAQLEKEQMAELIDAGIDWPKGSVDLGRKARIAAQDLGIVENGISIISGEARLNIGFAFETNISKFKSVLSSLKSHGAKSLRIDTGSIVNPGLLKRISGRYDAGKTYNGFNIEKIADDQFILTKDL